MGGGHDLRIDVACENGGDKLVHGSGGISQPRAEYVNRAIEETERLASWLEERLVAYRYWR